MKLGLFQFYQYISLLPLVEFTHTWLSITKQYIANFNLYYLLVSIIAEDKFIKDILDEHDIPCQTPAEADPIRILPAKCLGKIYSELGRYFGIFQT